MAKRDDCAGEWVFDGSQEGEVAGRIGSSEYRVFPCLGRSAAITAEGFQQILVATKYPRPTISGDLVPRPPLLTRLDEGLCRRLTIISAPAGYGKSTLALQWLAQTPADVATNVAWLSLDEGDDCLDHFLRYVLAALQTVVPGIGERLEPLLSSVPFCVYCRDPCRANGLNSYRQTSCHDPPLQSSVNQCA